MCPANGKTPFRFDSTPATAGASAEAAKGSDSGSGSGGGNGSAAPSGSTAPPAGGKDRVVVLHAYVPRSPDELALKVGEVLTVTGREDDGWWHGLTSDGAVGVFPSNFVRET